MSTGEVLKEQNDDDDDDDDDRYFGVPDLMEGGIYGWDNIFNLDRQTWEGGAHL